MTAGPASALARLYMLAPRGAELGLERVRAACERLGHPERAFGVVHVAGTNGKGSVCAFVDAMCRAAGLHVGLYTSPHLCRFAERIQIGGTPITDLELEEVLARALEAEPEQTFFEAATTAAYLAFARANVGIAVLEVGLGGRLDATNVIEAPRVTAITRIALDHTDRLGPDLTSIAGEKAGIIKPGVPLVLGPLVPEAREVALRAARAAGAPVFEPLADPALVARVGAATVALDGPHQRENAAIAVSIAQRLGLPDTAIDRGLKDVRWPGRLELLADRGAVLLDAAHNPDGAAALANAVRAHRLDPASVALVFGTMADKDWPAMLDLIAPLAQARFYVAPEGRQAADPASLAARAAGQVARTVREALGRARAAVGPGGTVLVCGSIFLVGAARAEILGIHRDPAVGL